MMVYKVTLLIVDQDELGADSIKNVIENVRYPNHCMYPEVMETRSRDIGEWDDDQPINGPDRAAEFKRLFPND